MPAMYLARLIDLILCDERRIISYLKKRIPCSCLKSSYNAVKHLPNQERSNSARCGAVGVVDENTTAQKHAKRLSGCNTNNIVKSGESGRLLKMQTHHDYIRNALTLSAFHAQREI
eukprot:scaffold42913_cov226-Skeletonema_marinoi.AAC.2